MFDYLSELQWMRCYAKYVSIVCCSRWLTEGLEQVVVVFLVVLLLIKYAMFDGRGELEQQLLRQLQQEQQGIGYSSERPLSGSYWHERQEVFLKNVFVFLWFYILFCVVKFSMSCEIYTK